VYNSQVDVEAYSRAAIDFHDLVLAAARNQVLRKLLETVYAQILVLRLRSLYLPERLASSVAEHRAIFAAVAAGDADRAEHLSRAHADHVLADALEFTGGAESSPDSVRVDAAPSATARGRR
jgi:DNA-binding GntR family transcriptional regulator